jgi:predicted RNA-binding Zn-ribbon protein involved in translation (DUF1610 family)
LTNAVAWVIQNQRTQQNPNGINIRVANLSMSTNTCAGTWSPEDQALRDLWNAGITVATSAGNTGENPCSITKFVGTPPGNNLQDIIFVGNMVSPGKNAQTYTCGNSGNEEGWAIMECSSRGENGSYGWANRQPSKPDVMAPGTEILSADFDGGANALVAMTGTSMASPYVAGLAVLAHDSCPPCTNTNVRDTILNSALNLEGGNDENVDTGHGLVDAVKTLCPTCGQQTPLGHSLWMSTFTLVPGDVADMVLTNPVLPLSVTSIAENNSATRQSQHLVKIQYKPNGACGANDPWVTNTSSGPDGSRQRNVFSNRSNVCKWRVHFKNSDANNNIPFKTLISF